MPVRVYASTTKAAPGQRLILWLISQHRYTSVCYTSLRRRSDPGSTPLPQASAPQLSEAQISYTSLDTCHRILDFQIRVTCDICIICIKPSGRPSEEKSIGRTERKRKGEKKRAMIARICVPSRLGQSVPTVWLCPPNPESGSPFKLVKLGGIFEFSFVPEDLRCRFMIKGEEEACDKSDCNCK